METKGAWEKHTERLGPQLGVCFHRLASVSWHIIPKVMLQLLSCLSPCHTLQTTQKPWDLATGILWMLSFCLIWHWYLTLGTWKQSVRGSYWTHYSPHPRLTGSVTKATLIKFPRTARAHSCLGWPAIKENDSVSAERYPPIPSRVRSHIWDHSLLSSRKPAIFLLQQTQWALSWAWPQTHSAVKWGREASQSILTPIHTLEDAIFHQTTIASQQSPTPSCILFSPILYNST